jgi:hypothetical protein
MPLGEKMEPLERHLAEDIAQVQIGVGDSIDVLTADFAAIAFVATHSRPPLG